MPGDVTASQLGYRDPFLGRLIGGRFRLSARIGSGAMGHVYRATRRDGDDVAVKVLRPELTADESMVKRFRREARAAQAVDSPHVVRILDYGESEGGVMYIAMELLEGESLDHRLGRDHRIGPREAVRIVRGVASALATAHAVGDIHRDLKPANVVIGSNGALKVVDFGIARLLEGSAVAPEITSKLTIAGTILGTPMYMSPEAAARKPVGPEADLYALGVMLFEMITGDPPFDDEDPILIIGMHLRSAPPLLREAAPDAPEALETLVASLLVKDPAQRPNAEALLSELDLIEVGLVADSEASGGEVLPDTLRDASLEDILGEADTEPDRPSPPEHPAAPTVVRPPSAAGEDRPPHRERSLRRWAVPAAVAISSLAAAVVVAVALRPSAEERPPAPEAVPTEAPSPPPSTSTPPPPAPPAEPEPGTLTVRSNVPCTLEVDGIEVGPTPVVAHELSSGVHRLRCVARGRGAAQARVEVPAGDTVEHELRFPRRVRGRRGARSDLDIAREYR